MADPTPPPETTSSPDATALANLQADYAALVAEITRLEASQSAASTPAKQEKPTDGMPFTIVVLEAYMLKGRENFVEWDGFFNVFLPDDVHDYLTGGRDKVNWIPTQGVEYERKSEDGRWMKKEERRAPARCATSTQANLSTESQSGAGSGVEGNRLKKECKVGVK